MKKEDRYQQNKEYWAENALLLNEKTYQQDMRRDRLTTTDEVKREHYELTQKHKENEQAKIEMEQRASDEKAEEERREFEEWKLRNKGKDDQIS